MTVVADVEMRHTSAFGVAAGWIAIVTGLFILVGMIDLFFFLPESTLPLPIPVILNYGIIPCIVLNGLGILCGAYAFFGKHHRRLVSGVSMLANVLLLLAVVVPLLRGMRPSPTPMHLGAELSHQLRYALRLADRVEIRPVFQGDPSPAFDPIVVDGPREIQALISRIIPRDQGSFGFCCCLGDLSLHFYSGTNRLATFSVHHGESLRRTPKAGTWQNGDWYGNVDITEESQRLLAEWFQQKGVPNQFIHATPQ